MFLNFLVFSVGVAVFTGIIGIVVGIIIGWILAVKFFKKQLKENPPITDKQIKELYRQMGRKPSEKQLQQIMSSLKQK